jgi:hypothetical protein
MKKIIIALAALVLLAGCTALNRVNPTDPKSGNYEGLHYTGSIGNFINLSDISAQDPDIIWCTDSTANKVYKYHENGDLDYMLYGGNITAPSGICADPNYFYLVDKDTVYHNLKRFDPVWVTNTAVTQPPLFASLVLNKCAVYGMSLYLTDNNTVYVFDTATTVNAMTGVTWQILWPNANISDIKVDRTGDVVIADSYTNDILVYSSAGSFISGFQYSFNIIGFAILGSYIYIPSNGGIHKINYPSLTEAQLLANYGQGNGKVDAPGPCDALSDGSILVGTANSIKIFVP